MNARLSRFAAGSQLTCEPAEQGLFNRGYRLCTTRGRHFLKHHFDPDTADRPGRPADTGPPGGWPTWASRSTCR